MTPVVTRLQSLTATLLSPDLVYNECRETALSLSKLFSEVVDLDEMAPRNQEDILTAYGKAIAPRWAASCIDDFMRTRKFILGIRDAINEKYLQNPGKPVTVLYAGAGPFAALLTPLITIFSPAQLQMILLEINPVSVAYLQKMVKQFSMEDYLIELVETDAATWTIPEHLQPDILVSETMNNALHKEPQVSIVANLLSQCSPGTILIPELVKVDACLLGNTMEDPGDILHLEKLLELDAETAVKIKNHPEEVAAISQGITVTIAELPPERFSIMVLNTTIRVFREHCIGFNESGITIPHRIKTAISWKQIPTRLLFHYRLESNPGFSVTED